MRVQQKLYDELLGNFDLIETVEVFRTNHEDPTEIQFTVLHEEAHRKATSSTAFGKLQYFLATLAREARKGGHTLQEWKKRAGPLLDTTIKSSWFAHEGFAVSRERT
jgi:hypothetical protein